MAFIPETHYPAAPDFFARLAGLYVEMDAAYHQTAEAYGFVCKGCADNCCQTRFYHHTHIEAAYLLSGFAQLSADHREVIRRRAREVKSLQKRGAPGADRLMCPLNEDGWCVLYDYRPMICRLHGLPHELQAPGMPRTFGPGCGEFERLCGNRPYMPFDRTPFYAQLAALEQGFKKHLSIHTRFKKTVAEALMDAVGSFREEYPL